MPASKPLLLCVLAASLAAPGCGPGAEESPPALAGAAAPGRAGALGGETAKDQAPPFSWPLRGRVTSPFGPSKTRSHHSGIDISGDERDPIRAAASGRVIKVADNAAYGLMLAVDHGGGYATWYGHTSALLVGKGDAVRRGQPIALVGDTGNAHGTHLHFEIRRNGRPVNPIPLLK